MLEFGEMNKTLVACVVFDLRTVEGFFVAIRRSRAPMM